MGKQSNQPKVVSQEQYDKDLNSSLKILHDDGASDQELVDYTNDFKSRFTVAKSSPQKKNTNQSGDSNVDNGFSGFPKSKYGIDAVVEEANKPVSKRPDAPQKQKAELKPMQTLDQDSLKKAIKKEASVPKDLSGKQLIGDNKSNQEIRKRDLEARVQQQEEIIAKAKTEYDPNITEENLQTEKEQTGVLNRLGQGAKALLNVTGEGLSAINESLGGTEGYFTIDDYKPLQDQQKKYIQKAKTEGLPLTPEAIQKGAEDIFREEDRMQQLHARTDANTPFGFNDKGVFEELNLVNVKKNDALKKAINVKSVYESGIDNYNKYAEYVSKLPKEQITQEIVDKHNNLLDNANLSAKALENLATTFPKLLEEVKTSEEILELTKYNYNDLEKHFASLKNFAKGLVAAPIKMGLETAAYLEEKTGISNPVNAISEATGLKEGVNDVFNDIREEQETFYHYKAKNINNLSDAGSYVAQFFSEQAPVYATLIAAPEAGIYLLGMQSAASKFSDMEYENSLIGGHKTSFDQRYWTSLVYGTAEGAFEKIGTAGILKRMQATIAKASTSSRKLFYDNAIKENVKALKRFKLNTFIETATELSTAESQIAADRYIAGKKISTQEANEIRFESGFGGALGGGVMSFAGGVGGALAQKARLYSDNQDIQKTNEILANIQGLSDELKNNPNLTVDDKKIIYKKMDDFANQSFDIVTRNAEKGKTFSKEENSFLVAVNLMQDGLKTEFQQLKDSNISAEQKKAMTEQLNASFNKLEENRNKTLKGEYSTIADNEKTFKREVAQEDNLIDDAPVSNETNSEPTNDGPVNPSPNNPPTPTSETEITTEDALNDLEVGTEEAPTTAVETPTAVEPAKEEAPTETKVEPINEQEYLDFVENDFLSNDRLNDIATKVRENEDLNAFEKRIASKKSKEISDINKNIQDQVAETNRKAEVDNLSKVPAMEKDEFLEYTNTEKATKERLDSIAYKNANGIELNNFEKEVYQDNKKEVNKINKDRNLKENLLDKIPADKKQAVKQGKLTVAMNGKELELYDEQGQPSTLSPKTKEKYFLEALENGFMKRTEELQYPEGMTESDVSRFELENETDPSVILEKLQETEINLDGSEASDYKDFAIASYINKVTQSSFVRFGDKNYITRGIALTYFSKNGEPIDTLAQEISESMDIEVTPQDVVDFIVANPNGKRNVLIVKNEEYQNLIDKFIELTGFAPTPSQIMNFKTKEAAPQQIGIEFTNEVEVNDQTLELIDLGKAAEDFDKWFSSLSPQEQVEFYLDLQEDYPNEYYQQRYNEQQDYEKSTKVTSTETPNGKGESKPDGGVGKNPQQDRPGSGNNNVPERKSGKVESQGEQGVKPTIENLEEDYNGKTLEELIALKKELYPNPDMESPMLPEEKLLDKVIAKKFSVINQEIIAKRKAKQAEAKEQQPETPKAEPKKSTRKVRDEKLGGKINDAVKDLLAGLGKLNSGINPEDLIKAAKVIALYTEAGIYKLSDIIEDLYERANGVSKELFDAIKFGYASFRENADDDTYSKLDENTRSVTYEKLIDKIKQDETVEQPIEPKPITDTKPIELKTKAIESNTDKLANDREAKIPTERKLEIANDLLFDIDSEIENVNDQLRLLGFYEPASSDEMRENPHVYIERELKKDLTNFVKKLNERLKWEFDTDKKGKPIYASANVAPAGGNGTFILWAPNSEYGIYVSVTVEPKEYKEWYEQYELRPTIMWRVTTKKDKYRGLSNQWMNSEDFTIPNLIDKFTKATNFYLKQENGNNDKQQPGEQGVSNPIGTLQPNSKRPSETARKELLQKPSEKQRIEPRSEPQSNPIPRTNRAVSQPTTGQGDLFSGDANFLEVEPKKKEVKAVEVKTVEQSPKEEVEVKIAKINQAEKQEPALVDFSMQDNEQEKFNATKKYTDNINALETLLSIIKEKRKATSEEKSVLAKYVGFGGLKEIAFNPDNEADWKESTSKYKMQVRKVIELTKELDQALGINNSLSEIRAGILTAHYTPKTIIDTMFNVLERLGFKNGNILEPSAGIGNFIGYMPSKMRSNSNITAVELDNTTGHILKYLYDDVKTQIKGIQDAIIPDNSQDVVISNVPFGNFKVFDKAFKGDREFLTKRIHNYFFAKALDKVREGGIVMFVTSKGILDSKGNREVREYLNQNAEFLGAVRLPSTAFQNNANTSVVTDVIILRKNTTSENRNPNFLDVVDLEVTDKNGEVKTITINKFFAENRNVLLGDIVPGGMYSEKDYSLADPDNKMGQIGQRVSSMLDKYAGTFQPTTNLNPTNRIETSQDLLENTKVGNIAISKDGKILKRSENEMQAVTMPAYVKPSNVKKYIDTRVALFDLITAEYTGQPDSVVDGLRTKLSSLYLNAVQTIPSKEFNRIALEDGDGFNVLSLTDKHGKRADILSKRTINPLQQKQNTDNVDEAIIISLYENAHIDMDRIAELMQKPVKEILEISKGKIFESPTGGFFTRDEYLSGNVKKKLAEVNQAIENGYTEFQNNKSELEAVIPKDIPAVSIEVRLGSRWVPLDIINDFAEHLFKDGDVVVNYAKSTDTYNNNGKSRSVSATEKWGTKRKNGADLLIDALHAATPAIYDMTEDKKRILNKEETEKAVQKFEEIRAEFENWVYTNSERRERLGAIYNEKYNTTVRRKYDGSHLNIPGINGVNLYSHQKDAIWMLLQNNGGIIDHIVGAGKAQPLTAKILTPSGWKLMGDIEVGDFVISLDGKPTKVTGVYPQGEKEIFKVVFSDNSSTECCKEHLWLTHNYKERNYLNSSIKKNKNWECSKPKVRTLEEISKTLRSEHLNALNHSIPVVNAVEFEEKELKIHPYLLGCLIGDGCLSNAVKFSTSDLEIIDYLKEVLPDNIKINYLKKYDYSLTMIKKSGFGKNITPNPLQKEIKELGLNCLSYTKTIPEKYLFNTVKNRIELLKGLMDTDGSVSKKGTSIYFHTSSNQLSSDFVTLIQSLGGVCSVKEKQPFYYYDGIKKQGAKSYNISVKLPESINPFKLKRKADKVVNKTKYKPVRYITKVESVGVKKAQCISVENPSKLYITDDFIVTHNTFVMVAGTAEMKRTGVAKKPMILALKSTIPQIVETYKQAYPLAKILSPSEKDFQAKNRQQLFSQIALNDWDVIIMSHENYQAIPHHPDHIRKQIDDEIREIEEERGALEGDKKALSGLETRLKNLEARLEKITDVAKDNAVYFQQMGIDHIMVDESQQFKNLAYMTKQRNVAGLSKPEGSRRAFNLLVGMRYLQETLGADKGTTFLSGTPISNSMVEMYSLLKYMRPNKMKELGFNTFDQWATTFANPTNEIEYSITGQFKSKTRFREFINVPELSLLYNEIADVRNDDNLILDKPKMKGGDYTSVFIEMSPEQADYGQRIIKFAKTKDGSVLGLDLSENQLTAYMLLATNLSSKMAIDMRLINKDYAYDPNGKVGKITDEVVKVYNASNEHKGTQLIFSDLGTPKNKNNQSEMLKDYLEDELGVPQDTLVELFGNFNEENHRYQSVASLKQRALDVLEIEENDFNEYVEQAKQSGESFNLYDEVKKRLIEKGIPENEIVFIHSYNNQKAKEKLFEQVNNGEIRVVLGSTQKLGTGVNVQKRLAAIHHLDVPWRPSDMEQRNGRGIRQGNWISKLYLDNEMPVYAYATIRTLDAFKYGLLQTKENFLRQIKSGNVEDRVIREADDQAGFAVMVAELSGNKDVLTKHKLEQEKERLVKQKRNFEGALYEAQNNVRKLESNIPAIQENINKSKQDIESITNKAEYEVTVDKESGIETKKLKIDNINGEVIQPEKDSKEAKEGSPVDRTEYGKKAIDLIKEAVKTIKLNEYTKAFDINGLPILAKVTNKREISNGKEYMIQKTELAILSPTGQTYTVNYSTIAGVLLNNIQKAIESIPIVLEMQEKVLEKNKKDLVEYQELAKNDKFPKEEELANVTAELKEIDKRIQDFEKDETEELDQEGNVVNEPNADYQQSQTQDGQKFLSLNEPGAEYSNGSENNKRSVAAVWTKYKNLQFKGTTKISSPEDVAKIMSLLENKRNEHAFAIHIDEKGNSHIQFLSIGGLTGTVIDPRLVSAGVAKFNSKKVYLVHNHPSGTMQPSNADLQATQKLRDGLNPLGIVVEHIIMDTYLKQYVHIDNDNLFTVNTRGENTFTKALTPIDLSEQEVLGDHFGKVTSSDAAFKIIQNFRFSAMPKNAILVLNNSGQVIGNYVFSDGKITYAEILKFVGETATGTSVVFYGNQANNLSEVKDFKRDLAKLEIQVLDKIVTSSDNEAVVGYYESMADEGRLYEDQEKYGTVINNKSNNIVNDPGASYNKDLRLPQTLARQALTQLKEDTRNKVANDTKLSNAIDIVQNSDWYQNLDDVQKGRVNRTTIKSLLENATKELNYLEDKIEEYKQQLKDNKLTTKQIFDDIVAFLQLNQIKGKVTPTEINRLIKSASQITTRKNTSKALDDFMNLYEIIKEKALFRSDKNAKEKAEVAYVVPMVESLVASGYDLKQVVDYFETDSQKRMAEIQYHKEKSKYATEEERVNKVDEALKKQEEDLQKATHISARKWLKKQRLNWFNLISDRSYVPANLMKKSGMEQSYYQFKNTNGYGHNAKEMYDKAFDKIWKGLTLDKVMLLNKFIQMMRIIAIDEYSEKPIQHPDNLSKIDAVYWLKDQKEKLGDKEFNNLEKRAKAYFKVYQDVLDLMHENGFTSQESYESLSGKDYQPRLFIQHALNFDGELTLEQKSQLESVKKGLSSNPIKKLDDGSANTLIYDAQFLLSNSISTLYRNIADNNINSLLVGKEFPIALEKQEELLSLPYEQLTKDEKKFLKYFEQLKEKVIPNKIISFDSETNEPNYEKENPGDFVSKHYWIDGVKHQFFMQTELAMQFDGVKRLFLNDNKAVIEWVRLFTGVSLLKYMATGNNPTFFITNTSRDFAMNILVSEHYSNFVPLAMAQMTYQLFPSTYDFVRTKLGYENTDMNLFFQHGGSFEYLHKQGALTKKSIGYQYIKKPLTSVLGKNNQPIVEHFIDNNWLVDVMTSMNEWSEIAFRIATFRRAVNSSLKKLGYQNESQVGDVIDENGIVIETKQEILNEIYRKAVHDAKKVLNFSEGGRLIKDLDYFVPYLNVSVQASKSLANAMQERPEATSMRIIQMVTMAASAFITLAMYMLAGDDDEPEEEKGKSVEKKYIDFMEGVSKETRSKYYIIPTKKRDEKGNRIFYKIAKEQMLIPYNNLVETLIENKIRTRTGYKEIGWNDMGTRLMSDIAEYNLPGASFKDVPLIKAGVSWYAGYDLYRDKPFDKFAKATMLEGMNNPNVEDFYKHFGREMNVSPIRMKNAIESIVTSPETNAYLATGYEVMDYSFTDKSMEGMASGIREMFIKGIKNRTSGKSTDWTRSENVLSENTEGGLDIMLKEEATRELFKQKAKDVISGEADKDEVIKDLKEQYKDDANLKSYLISFMNQYKKEKLNAQSEILVQKLSKITSPGARASAIINIYGDVIDPENKDVYQMLIKNRVINAATLKYLRENNKKTAE